MPFATAPDGARLYYETEGTGEPLLRVTDRGVTITPGTCCALMMPPAGL